MEDRSERTPLLVPHGDNNQGAAAAARVSVASRVLALGAMCVATVCVAFGTANVGTILQSKQGQAAPFGAQMDPLVPKYYPLNENNVIATVHTLNVPTTGADAEWDASFLANVAGQSGADPATLIMREVVYEIHANIILSGIDCKDHEAMHLFEMAVKSVRGLRGVGWVGGQAESVSYFL